MMLFRGRRREISFAERPLLEQQKSLAEKIFMGICFSFFLLLIVVISYQNLFLAKNLYGEAVGKSNGERKQSIEKDLENLPVKNDLKKNTAQLSKDTSVTKKQSEEIEKDKKLKPSINKNQEKFQDWEKIFTKVALVKNEHVDYFVKLYQTTNKDILKNALLRMINYWGIIEENAKKYRLPLEIALLGIIESEFNPKACSVKGAAGIWQLMPKTARLLGIRAHDRWDARKSTKAAFRYLQNLALRYHGNWPLVFAAYNGGGSYIHQMVRKYRYWNFWKLYQVPGFKKETYHYVPKFYAVLYLLKNDKSLPRLPIIQNVKKVKSK